jgi:hypothetical protein
VPRDVGQATDGFVDVIDKLEKVKAVEQLVPDLERDLAGRVTYTRRDDLIGHLDRLPRKAIVNTEDRKIQQLSAVVSASASAR